MHVLLIFQLSAVYIAHTIATQTYSVYFRYQQNIECFAFWKKRLP